MTTRHSGYLVVLDDDIREDDAEHLLNAIRMIKFVRSADPVEADFDQVIARQRHDCLWSEALIEPARNDPGNINQEASHG